MARTAVVWRYRITRPVYRRASKAPEHKALGSDANNKKGLDDMSNGYPFNPKIKTQNLFIRSLSFASGSIVAAGGTHKERMAFAAASITNSVAIGHLLLPAWV
jgi:hypothetical protein